MKKVCKLFLILPLLFIACKEDGKSNIDNKSDSATTVVTSTTLTDNPKVYNNIHIKAKPDSIAINESNTAVIVVDMENDFGAKGGMFDKAGINISMIKNVVMPTANVLSAARKAGIKIIYLKMGYHADLSDVGIQGSPNQIQHIMFMHVGDTIKNPTGLKSRILIRDTWGTDIIPELAPQADDIVVYKTRFSGFYKTNLDSILRKLDKRYLIVTGCTTSVCVESTVRDAMFRDYSSIVLQDCVAEPIGYNLPRSNHDASLLVIERVLGWVSTSRDFINAVQAPLLGNQKRQ